MCSASAWWACAWSSALRSRERVLRERRKNVHAFLRGTPTTDAPPEGEPGRVTYNPYTSGSFVVVGTNEPITAARYAEVRPEGVFVWV